MSNGLLAVRRAGGRQSTVILAISLSSFVRKVHQPFCTSSRSNSDVEDFFETKAEEEEKKQQERDFTHTLLGLVGDVSLLLEGW